MPDKQRKSEKFPASLTLPVMRLTRPWSTCTLCEVPFVIDSKYLTATKISEAPRLKHERQISSGLACVHVSRFAIGGLLPLDKTAEGRKHKRSKENEPTLMGLGDARARGCLGGARWLARCSIPESIQAPTFSGCSWHFRGMSLLTSPFSRL